MKQLLWAPIAVLGVGTAFAVVAGLVWLTRGRRAPLVRGKLFLGGLLLALGVGGCHQDDDLVGPRIAMCYSAVTTNTIVLTSRSVHLKSDPTVRGTIYAVEGSAFSFVMLRSGPPSAEVVRGTLVADDGAFDEPTETFHFGLPADLQPGAYTLTFYLELADARRLLGDDDLQVLSD